MGFDINGTKLVLSGTSVQVQNASSTVLSDFDNTGKTIKNINHPMFYGCGSTANWIALTVSTWNQVATESIGANHGSGLATNGNYTAPVSGLYLFTSSNYCYNSATTNAYYYSVFLVNGGWPNGLPTYRNVGLGVTAGYSSSANNTQIMKLTAGDVVTCRIQPTSASQNVYGTYGHFAGWFLG